MGTKNNPGAFDCYANAAPDEPMFVLLGRDKHAAGLARLWALLRAKDDGDDAKIAEALACADAMDSHALSLGKIASVTENDVQFHALYMTATEGLAEHPEAFEHPCMCDLCKSDGY